MTIYLHKSDPCCSKVIIDGGEGLRQIHGDKLGIYEKTLLQGNDQVFKSSGKEYYLFRNPKMQWTVRLT